MSQQRVPESPVPFLHLFPVQLRFNDVDMLGHVNNNVYLQLFDAAKYDYFRSVMGDGFDIRRLALVVVNINCDFYEPSYLDEPLQVMTATERIGDKSITLLQRIVNVYNAHVKCQCRTVMAAFDPHTLTSASVDADSRAKLEAFENRSF